MTTSSSYFTQSKIEAKKGNKNASERKLNDPLRNNNKFDPDTDEDMIIGSNYLVPFDADARRVYLKTFTKEALAYYNNYYRGWAVFPMNINPATGKPGTQVAVYVESILKHEQEVIDRQNVLPSLEPGL
jgi:hypothetical protein